MVTVLRGLGGMLFFGCAVSWFFIVFFRAIGEYSLQSLFVEAVLSVGMSVGYFVQSLALLAEAPLYFPLGLVVATIPFGLTAWMVGYYKIMSGGDNGWKWYNTGKRMFLFGLIVCLIAFVVGMVIVAVTNPYKPAPSSLPK